MADGTDKKRKKTKASKTNWIVWGIAIVVLYIGGFLWIIGPQPILSFFMKTKELNNIGDFLAGVFAFPAFVLLATAVLTQRQELNETREQFEDAKEVTEAQLKLIHEQNRLSHRAAQANYKLAMHEKRLSVYFRLKELALVLNSRGSLDRSERDNLERAAEDARFIFDDDIMKYVNALRYNSEKLSHAIMKVTWFQHQAEQRELQETQKAELDRSQEDIEQLGAWFLDKLQSPIIVDVFELSLKLPDDIALDQLGAKTEL